MTFNTPNGTRGGSFPSAEEMRKHNEPNIAKIRQGMSVGNLLVLITVGKKTGELRQNPVAYFAEPSGAFLIVASAAGRAQHPAWYFNIGAHPDEVRIVINGSEVPVAVEELDNTDRAQAWARITAKGPGFARYQEMTDRQIPVIRLRPRVTAA